MPVTPAGPDDWKEATDHSEVYHARLRDTVSLMIGTAILIAPWFNGDDAATHGALRLRFLAALVCAGSLWLVAHRDDRRAEWLNAILGAALATSPFWRGGFDAGRLDVAIAGGIVCVFAVSCLAEIYRAEPSSASPVVRRTWLN